MISATSASSSLTSSVALNRENVLVLNDAINAENVPLSNKIPGNVMGKDLHYCIYYSLIIRTRKYARNIVELLKNNNYVPSDVACYSTAIHQADNHEVNT